MKTLITILLLGLFISSEAQNISQSQVRQFNAVTPYRVFGRGAGVGTPSFITLDSNHIPQLHSQGYYDGRYGSLSVQNTNTSSISANTTAIGTKLNITDTANIRLRPVAGSNMTITGTYPNLTFNSTASGGGSSGLNATTAIDSTTTHFSSFNAGLSSGTSMATVGTFLYEKFTGTSIPSGWTKTGAATVIYNNKLSVSGGTNDFGTYLEPIGYFNYDKERISWVTIPKDKTATSYGQGVSFGSNINAGLTFTNANVQFNLTNGVDSGRVTIGTTAASASLSFSVGDSLVCSLIKDGWRTTAGMLNKRTGQRVEADYYDPINTGGKFRLSFLGGSQDITEFKAESWNLKNVGVAIVGDSHGYGYGTTSEGLSWALQAFKTKYRYSNFSHPSISSNNWMTSDKDNLVNVNPKYAIVALGYNDRGTLGTDTTTFKTRYIPIVDTLISRGITPILTTLVPSASSTTDIFSTAITNVAASRGVKLIDIRTALMNGNTAGIYPAFLGIDGIHLSDSGALAYSITIRKVAPELFDLYTKDTTSNVVLNNLPQGKQNDNLVVADSKGNLYSIPNTVPKAGWLTEYQKQTLAVRGNNTGSQTGAGLYLSFFGATTGADIRSYNYQTTAGSPLKISASNTGISGGLQVYSGDLTVSSSSVIGSGNQLRMNLTSANGVAATYTQSTTGGGKIGHIIDATPIMFGGTTNSFLTGYIFSTGNWLLKTATSNAWNNTGFTDNGSKLQVDGSVSFSYSAKTAAYTLAATDYTIDCNGTFTVTLPTAVGITGRIYVIKNSGTGTITAAAISSQTIDGATTQSLSTQYQTLRIQSTGTNWITL